MDVDAHGQIHIYGLYTYIHTCQAVCNLHEQLSVTLWKFNARMLLDRLILEGNTVASFGQ